MAVSRAGAYWALTLECDGDVIYKGSLAASSSRFLFEGLESGKNCRGKIYMVDNGQMGEVHTFEFTTDPVTCGYPFVKFSGNYRVGDVLYVFVQNLVEEHTGIQIMINGEKLPGNSYEFTQSGVHDVEVSIRYPDSSVDVITKRIEVKN